MLLTGTQGGRSFQSCAGTWSFVTPRPAPDLDLRRDHHTRAAWTFAEAEGWEVVTMRRLASELGVTQPVIYSAFAGGRRALIDAIALSGFAAIAAALDAVPAKPLPRKRAYLEFASHTAEGLRDDVLDAVRVAVRNLRRARCPQASLRRDPARRFRGRTESTLRWLGRPCKDWRCSRPVSGSRT